MPDRSAMAAELFPADEVLKLSAMKPDQTGDTFALLASCEQATTKNGKPYFRVKFQDAARSVDVMIWSDTPLFKQCEADWSEGQFYKLRGRYYENDYGKQFEIERIRPINDEDRDAGFKESDFLPSSRFDADGMWKELLEHLGSIEDAPLRKLATGLFQKHEEVLKYHPAASRNHHAYRSGYLEHTLSVVRTAIFLADKYLAYYPGMTPPLSKDLCIAGAALHDIGKLLELDAGPSGGIYTPAGKLVGHILLGRDLVRDAAREQGDVDPELLLRLEHIIISHQNLPEWGSPVAPHTPEALLVHYSDEIDAKYHMFAVLLEEEPADGETFTNHRNAMRRGVFRGLPAGE